MYAPSSFGVGLTLALVSLVCWGSWANAMRIAGGVRFEVFYYDFALGVFLCAVIFAFALGGAHVGDDDDTKLNFPGSLHRLHGDRFAYAFFAGVVFNIANFLLIAAIDIAGMAIAFPAGIGTAMVMGTVLNYIIEPGNTNAVYLFIGLVLAAAAIVFNSFAFKYRNEDEALSPENHYRLHDPESPRSGGAAQSGSDVSTSKALTICLICGVLMGSWSPLSTASMQEGAGQLSPYTSFFLYTLGVVVTTFPMIFVFSKKPLIGEPFNCVEEYVSTQHGVRWHMAALLGGLVWAVGTLFNLMSGQVIGTAPGYAIGQSAPLVAACWGIFVWKEFKDPSRRVVIMLCMTFLFYAGAIGLVALSSQG
eukprot:GFYU01001919.1.p1 GENE.GFYU01001919.1~~GFYU01001919.1.p1  ORF type:complete len:363 (-),score=96.46 GFYU01001919.1:252-1340(-)